jgi:hypothetical protein
MSNRARVLQLSSVCAVPTPERCTPQAETSPATGAELLFESVDLVRIRDGKILSWHVYCDSVPVLRSLGLMPEG